MSFSEKLCHETRDIAQNDSVSSTYENNSNRLVYSSRQEVNVKLANPLSGFSKEELRFKGREYAVRHSLTKEEDLRAFEIGAMLAQDPEKFEDCQDITAEDMEVLRKEFTNRWSQPKLLYLIIVLCSTCAAVQGMGKQLVFLAKSSTQII